MLEHVYNITIERVVVEPVHDREVVDGINTTAERCLWILMAKVKLPGYKGYTNNISIKTPTHK